MTREEFIKGYCERSDISDAMTDYGYAFEDLRSVALRCTCGEPECDGWQMISADPLVSSWAAYREDLGPDDMPDWLWSDDEFQKHLSKYKGVLA